MNRLNPLFEGEMLAKKINFKHHVTFISTPVAAWEKDMIIDGAIIRLREMTKEKITFSFLGPSGYRECSIDADNVETIEVNLR